VNNRCCYVLHIIIFSLFVTGAIAANDKTPDQLVEEARAQVKSVSVHDVKKMMDTEEDVIILDIRDREEYEKGHIPGAMHISRGLLEFMVAGKIPNKNAKIIVY